MSGNDNKLSQSLEDIISTRANGRKRGGARSGPRAQAGPKAPVGGVQKSGKNNSKGKGGAKPAAPAAPTGEETKIMISNLPKDVDEDQLKDYFATAVKVGRPKRVFLQYGADGRSLGSATVIFNRSEQAVKAVKALDNVKIDGRLVRVELLVSAASVPAPAPKPALAERVSQPKKDKPKPATATKTPGAVRGGRGRRGGGRGGRAQNTRSKKTVEELDQEMADYFPQTEGNGDVAAVPNGGADDAMDEAL